MIDRRLERDRPYISQDRFNPKQILLAFTSPHVIINAFIMVFMLGVNAYGLAFFAASIVNQLGFSSIRSQLLSVGPFAVSFFGMYSRIWACAVTVMNAISWRSYLYLCIPIRQT